MFLGQFQDLSLHSAVTIKVLSGIMGKIQQNTADPFLFIFRDSHSCLLFPLTLR